jgi:hypothetical protein
MSHDGAGDMERWYEISSADFPSARRSNLLREIWLSNVDHDRLRKRSQGAALGAEFFRSAASKAVMSATNPTRATCEKEWQASVVYNRRICVHTRPISKSAWCERWRTVSPCEKPLAGLESR